MTPGRKTCTFRKGTGWAYHGKIEGARFKHTYESSLREGRKRHRRVKRKANKWTERGAD